MQPPSEISVGPYVYTVSVGGQEWDRQAAEEAQEGTGYLYGRCDHPVSSIVLRDGLSAAVTAETLLHEIMHACVYLAGQPLNAKAEEAAISSLAPTLLHVLRENPRLVAYLTGA